MHCDHLKGVFFLIAEDVAAIKHAVLKTRYLRVVGLPAAA